MATNFKDGGTAFPCNVNETKHEGLSKRDYFACNAIKGLLSYQSYDNNIFNLVSTGYRIADEMLRYRG